MRGSSTLIQKDNNSLPSLGVYTYIHIHTHTCALHIVVARIEMQIKTGEYALGTFLDINAAFSARSFQVKSLSCDKAANFGTGQIYGGESR